MSFEKMDSFYRLHSMVRSNIFALFQIGFLHSHISTWRVKMDMESWDKLGKFTQKIRKVGSET